MIFGRASTVCERSPPASCSRMMLPLRRCCLTRWKIRSAPGRSQSSGSMLSITVR